MVVNAAQLASYSQAKQGLLDTGYVQVTESGAPVTVKLLENVLYFFLLQDGIFCHFLASMFSGLVTTIASMPVDIAKTRLQSMKYIDGLSKYFLLIRQTK